MNLLNRDIDSRKTVLLLYLTAAGIVLFPFVMVDGFRPGWGYFLAEKYLAVPALLFFGAALTQPLSALAKRCLLLSSVTVLWFAAVQLQHQMVGMGTRSFGIFAVVYLLAFPFCAVAEDGRENTGLKCIAGIYTGFSLLLSVFAVMLLLDAVPEVLKPFVYWDGTRAAMFWHPNGGGCVLMLGIGMTLYLLTQTRQKRIKYLLAGLILLQFVALILTNSRTTILVTCALIGGTVFFAVWKGQGKQLFTLGIAAVALVGVLILAYSTLQELHVQSQIDKLLEEAGLQADQLTGEVVIGTQRLMVDPNTGEIIIKGFGVSGQNSFFQDLFSFNGRTRIWKAAFAVLQDIPEVRIWGTEYYGAEMGYRLQAPIINAHNSWIQTMLVLGIPGLLLTLVFTVLAIWNLWSLMWNTKVDLGKKVIALVVVCILASSILEAYLFAGEMPTSFVNFLFFLCTGYLIHWNRAEKE